MPLALIGFDGDDTLWLHGHIFVAAQKRILEIVRKYVNDTTWASAFVKAREQTVGTFGYGVKSFILSAIEVAIRESSGRIPSNEILQMIDLAKAMIDHDLEVSEETRELLAALRGKYRLILITKGNRMEQETKLRKANISDLFDDIELVYDKNVRMYEHVLRRAGVAPQSFAMVGDSIKSDVIPVLSIGGWAVHIPNAIVWEHEGTEPPADHPHYFFASSMRSVAEALKSIEQQADLE
jgi:putative hydrolase of the HAD superfamily